MTFKQVIPTLRTADIRKTINFYEKFLGFECKTFDEDWKFASLQRDEITLQWAAPDAKFPFREEGVFQHAKLTGSIYFYIDDVDALYEQVKDEVKICYHLQSFDYGMREFGMFDNNGYLLQFGSQMEG